MSWLRISKFVATGNDFLFVDGREAQSDERARLAANLCERHTGLGADGMVFVDGLTESHPRWDFYNADGSFAAMCGNASRCMGRWSQRFLGLNELKFETSAGSVRVEVRGPNVISYLDYMSLNFLDIQADVGGRKIAGVLVDTGVPHAVIGVDDINLASIDLETVKAFRFHPRSGARGANVTYLQIQSDNAFASVTFERGIEGFTLSCGTGVLAAAAVGLRSRGKGGLDAEVATPGGRLTAGFRPSFKGARLEGPAAFVFETELEKELWR